MTKIKVFAALALVLVMAASPLGAFAYNAEPSELTGGLDGIEMAKTVAEEGMVLLENHGALPLEKGSSIAIFGINQIDFIHGGGGSGNFASRNERVGYVGIYDGLKEKQDAGEITLYGKLVDKYRAYYDDYWKNDGRRYAYGTGQGAVIKFRGEMDITADDAKEAANAADIAIVTIGRPAGEDDDRKNADGDFKLNEKERNMLEYVKSAGFKKIIVILNVTGVIESDWLEDEKIDAVLLISLPGMVGGRAVADVLMGKSYPSGRLVDTWAGNYADYPSSKNFGDSGHTNYEEDIFVGYRYFSTIPDAQSAVNYPFGYGLDYADFEISNASLKVDGVGRDRTVTVTATVINKGKYPGKDVIQIYSRAPEGKLSQSARELSGFYKTRELSSGESENVTVSFPFDDLSSYDDLGVTEYEAAYVLEDGEYEFYIGENVRDAVKLGSYRIDSTECVNQLSHHLVPDTTKLTKRLRSDGSTEPLIQKENAPLSDDGEKDVDARYKEIYTNPETAENDDEFITFYDLATAFADGESADDTRLLEAFVARLTDAEAVKLTGCTSPVGGKGHRTGIAGLEVYGLPVIGTANGPAGIQYNGSANTWETTTTFYPCATMQAQTWNTVLIEQLGAAMADEARHFGMSLWQAPGMNIHRDPLCGRNFEYFSEDPLISGKMGAAITRGVQSRRFASQLKHFAFNNQERGRWGNDSRISERAVREIYLKGYEIAVKEGNPWSIMSSYNRINGTQTSGSYDLLTEILRNEWGFDGFVMTDFRTRNVSHPQEIFAGNDLKAPADSPRPGEVLSAMNSWLPRWKVLRSAERIVRFALKTEDAAELAEKDFEYKIALSSSSNKIDIGSKVILKGGITWGEFLDSLIGRYNQSYTLLDVYGNEINDASAPLAVGMTVIVTAEDGKTQKRFDVVTGSLALGKTSKASHSESNDFSAAKAFDGNLSTRWSGFDRGKTSWGNWVEVDLGEEYHINRIDISFYLGGERNYTYQVFTAPSEAEKYRDDAKKDRDFIAQGYELSVNGKSQHHEMTSDKLDTLAQYIAVKIPSSEGGFGPTLWEIEVYGWKLESGEYAIDDKSLTIAVTDGDTTSDYVGKLKLTGDAEIEFSGGSDTWINAGEKFIVTDAYGTKTVYTVISPDEVAAINADFKSDSVTLSGRGRYIAGIYGEGGSILGAVCFERSSEFKVRDAKYVKFFTENGIFLKTIYKE